MNRLMLNTLGIGMVLMAGCVSIESTRARLNSGIASEVAKAEEDIFAIATTGFDKNQIMNYQESEQIDFVNLSTNQTLLARIVVASKNGDVAIAAARKLNFSEEESIVSFINNYESELNKVGREVKSEIIKSMLSTSSERGMIKAAIHLTRAFSSKRRSFEDLREPLGRKLIETSTNENVLLSILEGKLLCLWLNDSDKDVVLSKISDQKILMSLFCTRLSDEIQKKVLAKLNDNTLCDFILNDSRFNDELEGKWVLGLRVQANEKIWRKILIEKDNSNGIACLFGINCSQEALADVCINAKNPEVIKTAVWKLQDYSAIASVLMSNKITDEKLLDRLVDRIKNGAAEYELYNAVKNPTAKKAILAKVSNECRVKIREASRSACEKLIAAANGKSAETFELGGFYLGMKIEDAEMLIGYHFPDIVVHEGEVDGFRILSVRGQFAPLCYAKKNGEVFQLNFGKKMLKKWYKFDVQGYDEWANAYSQKEKVSMTFKRISKTATVRGNDGMSCNVSFEQETYQYKNNLKNYRLTYYGQDKDPVLGGLFSLAEGTSEAQLIKMLAAKEFIHIRSDPGTLRIAFEED